MKFIMGMALATFFLVLAILTNGCGFKASDVAAKKSHSDPGLQPLGMPELCTSGTNCGAVTINLKQADDDDHWTYWRAGTNTMIERPDGAFIRSNAWDMRVTKYFPLVGSNGGKTAADEGWTGGSAAFAVMPDPPGSIVPVSVDQVRGLSFTDDRYEGLEFGGVKLGAEYQNPLVNTIGPGLLKNYNMRDHSVELSYRIFVLRTADGATFYALRFRSYSRADNRIVFDWRRLQ